jgi:hypothetical protein
MATKSASFSTLCRIDLPLNGDIAEFCPCAGYERSLAVGTYELIEVPAAHLATISQPTPMRRSYTDATIIVHNAAQHHISRRAAIVVSVTY